MEESQENPCSGHCSLPMKGKFRETKGTPHRIVQHRVPYHHSLWSMAICQP